MNDACLFSQNLSSCVCVCVACSILFYRLHSNEYRLMKDTLKHELRVSFSNKIEKFYSDLGRNIKQQL